ncbi:MAG: ParB/RepB/Spo0J family partition protein [Rhodocyclales bacterium GT-UBC]|nr:MAG: ParB/RepB/Spo0J family partition protein [Rhodocyclales bacterium GT-UBC]
MTFKTNEAQFLLVDIEQIIPDPTHPRQNIDEASLRGLANSIEKKGLIHPLVVQPADTAGVYRLIVGERRWRAARLAGETTLPVLVRACSPEEALEIRVFENLGLGVRAALEPRDMANAIQHIAERFETQEAAAEHFARSPTWLSQATAAANLSPKVSALLDAGKISSTGAAVKLEKLAQKNEAKAETLIVQIEQLPEGEKLPAKVVDNALQEAGGRRRKKEESGDDGAAGEVTSPPPASSPAASSPTTPPWEEAPSLAANPSTLAESTITATSRVNPGKVRMVARILGLDDGNEDEILARLVDEFLAMKGEGT